jgi:TolA-binding protein
MLRIKNKGLWFLIASMGLILLSASPVFPDQIIIKSDDLFDYARTCMERDEYSRAVGEFDKFIHFFPKDPLVPSARYLIGMCYLKDKHQEIARKIFSQIIKSNPNSPLAGKALFMIGESYYQQAASKEAEYYFEQVIKKDPSQDLKNAALYRLGWTKMQYNKWPDASEIFSKVEKESLLYDSSQVLVKQSLEGETLPYKNPKFAGSLAAIVPGLGHAYVSRYRDAVVAFLINGLFIWAAVESFNKDLDVLGGILTFMEVGWYTGNIYSAVNVAHKHNRKVRNDFRKSLKDRLDFRLFSSGKDQIGLALVFSF